MHSRPIVTAAAVLVTCLAVWTSPAAMVGGEIEGKNLLANGGFERGQASPSGWGVKVDGPKEVPPGTLTLSRSRFAEGKRSLRIDTSQVDGVIVRRRIDLAALAGKDVILRGKVFFEKVPASGRGQLYLRIRQWSGGKFIGDAVRIWCVVTKDKMLLREWRNGRLGRPRTIKDYLGKWIPVRGRGTVARGLGSREVFIYAGSAGRSRQSDVVCYVDDLAVAEVIPPVLELGRIRKTYYTNEDSIHFQARVNPRPAVTSAKGYRLIVQLILFRDDILVFQREREYLFSSNEKEFAFPIKGCLKGRYVLKLRLQDTSGKTVDTSKMKVEIIEPL